MSDDQMLRMFLRRLDAIRDAIDLAAACDEESRTGHFDQAMASVHALLLSAAALVCKGQPDDTVYRIKNELYESLVKASSRVRRRR